MSKASSINCGVKSIKRSKYPTAKCTVIYQPTVILFAGEETRVQFFVGVVHISLGGTVFMFSSVNSDGVMWSFNYFFYNNELNRVLCFSCTAQSKWSGSAMSGRRTPGALKSGGMNGNSRLNQTPGVSPSNTPRNTLSGFRNSGSPLNLNGQGEEGVQR